MSSEEDAPKHEEKEEQLRRILASATFAKHPVSAALLERLVRDSLHGKPPEKGYEYEHALGVEVFGKGARWDPSQESVVREGLRSLRGHLARYYSAEGANDKVEISFPKRSGYAARFSYRAVDDGEETVRRLCEAFWHSFPDLTRCANVVQELKACVDKHPTYAPAYGVLAEAILACATLDQAYDVPISQAIVQAEEAVQTGLSLNRELWRLHVIAGALHCCRFKWAEADAAFKAALHLSPEEAGAHFWYIAFLIAVGRTEEAAQCISRRLERPHTRLTPYLRPLFLYVMRDFDQAFHEMRILPLAYRTNATWHYKGHGTRPIDEWPGELLMACLFLTTEKLNDAALAYASAGVENSKVDAFSGLKHHAWWHTPDQFEFGGPPNYSSRSHISAALGVLNAWNNGELVEQLSYACDAGHPLMIWLHLWPMFDPWLRKTEAFKALVKRMNLP